MHVTVLRQVSFCVTFYTLQNYIIIIIIIIIIM